MLFKVADVFRSIDVALYKDMDTVFCYSRLVYEPVQSLLASSILLPQFSVMCQ
jgi:hypothetical protein